MDRNTVGRQLKDSAEELKFIVERYGRFIDGEKISNSCDGPPSASALRKDAMKSVLATAKGLRWEFDYESLANVLLDYESEIESHFMNTVEHVQFLMYKACYSFYHQGNEEQATRYFHQALAIPAADMIHHAMVYRELGSMYRWLEAYDQAEESYQQAKNLMKKYPEYRRGKLHIELLYCLGVLYQDMGRYFEAMKAVEKAIKHNKNNNSYHYLDLLYRLKSSLVLVENDIEASTAYLQKARTFNDFRLPSEQIALEPYLTSTELMIELTKAGISIHDGRLLIRYELDKIIEIYNDYMSKPTIKEALLQYETNQVQKKMKKLQAV